MERLKTIRKARGMTQCDLSKQSGVSRAVIARIESGATPTPPVKTLGKLAVALDVRIDDIIDYSEHQYHNTESR